MNKAIIQLITTYPMNHEPVIKNRLTPFIHIAIKQGFKVQLISPDMKPFMLESKCFQHICSPDKTIKPRGFIKRALFENAQARRLLKIAQKNLAEHRLVTIPSMFLLFNVHIINKGDFTVDVRDLTWEYLPTNSSFNKLIKKLFTRFALSKLKLAKNINVTNNTELQYFVKNQNITNSNLNLVTNGVSQKQFDKLSSLNHFSADRPVVSYIGNVGIAQNLTVLIDVAEELTQIDFIIVGAGTDFERVKSYLSSKNITNLKLTGRLEWEKVIEVYERSNILFAQLTKNFSGAMPSKLYEYLSTGKYVLYGGGKQAKEVLSLFDNTSVIEPDDPKEITEKLKQLLGSKLYLNISSSNKDIVKSSYIREQAVENYFAKLRG